jgi:hypothetical protein
MGISRKKGTGSTTVTGVTTIKYSAVKHTLQWKNSSLQGDSKPYIYTAYTMRKNTNVLVAR